MAPKKDQEHLKIVGGNITKLRKQKGLTIADLAYMCDMEKNNLIPIEKGRRNVTLNTLIKISKALEVELMDLLKV